MIFFKHVAGQIAVNSHMKFGKKFLVKNINYGLMMLFLPLVFLEVNKLIYVFPNYFKQIMILVGNKTIGYLKLKDIELL